MGSFSNSNSSLMSNFMVYDNDTHILHIDVPLRNIDRLKGTHEVKIRLKDETNLITEVDWKISFRLPYENQTWVFQEFIPPVINEIEVEFYGNRVTAKAVSVDYFGRVEIKFNTKMVT